MSATKCRGCEIVMGEGSIFDLDDVFHDQGCLFYKPKVEMSEQEEIDYNLEIVRQRSYPNLTLDEMREIFNETYERLVAKHHA